MTRKNNTTPANVPFTGGGIIRIPRKPGGVAVYSFPTENGLMLDVPERYYIVLTPDGKFGKMDAPTFIANFEEKDDNAAVLDFSEKRLFEKMNKLFGKNFQRRFTSRKIKLWIRKHI